MQATAETTEIALTGTFRAVNWVTRTAQLYDDDDNTTTVHFTPEQDNWLKLVVNIPVNLKATPTRPEADPSRNGQDAPGTDATTNGAPETDFLQLTEVKVIQRGWFPYDTAAFQETRRTEPFDFENRPRGVLGMSGDEFMRLIRGPDYDSNAV